MPPKRAYSREFKLETLQLLKSSGKTRADLERELGLYPGQIHLREKAFNRKEHDVKLAFPGTGHQSDAEAAVDKLKRENEILRQKRNILKKPLPRGKALLLQDARPRLKFAFIQRHRREYEITIMCRVLGVSKGGYYTWVKRQEQPPSRREMANQELTAAIQATFKRSRRTYGAPRIHAELNSAGTMCSLNRVARLMRKAGIRARCHRKTR